MKTLINQLPAMDPETKAFNVIIETPKGSRVKYGYDPASGLFELSKALPAGLMFPFNFGFIPSTLGGDGDPLDILILNEEPLFPGCLLKATLVGVIRVAQSEGKRMTRNDRLVGRATDKLTPPEMESMRLTSTVVSQVEYFFMSYNKLRGVAFKVLGVSGAGKAKQIVRKAEKALRG
jgi:inorganic pyrophosphatase